jgi:DNA-binding transcriptional ArsR family regulator
MTYGNALVALSDGTRRAVFEHLRNGPLTVQGIADQMPVSRPAVSQHLKVLKQAGLVTDVADGARRIYSIDPKGLGELRAWLDQFWGTALDAFQTFVDSSEVNHERKGPGRRHPGRTGTQTSARRRKR